MGPTERIERAIDRITTIGWCQGSYVRYCGRRPAAMCAVGALAYEPDTEAWEAWDDEVREAEKVVLEVLGNPGTYLVSWNDEEGRQAHEVIGALVMAAELSRKREFAAELVPA